MNLSKNEVTRKRKYKYTTNTENEFLSKKMLSEAHDLAIVNFMVFLFRRKCISADTPKDLIYDVEVIK